MNQILQHSLNFLLVHLCCLVIPCLIVLFIIFGLIVFLNDYLSTIFINLE